MKKSILLAGALLFAITLNAQDTVRLTVCNNFWKNGEPITGVRIYAGNPNYNFQIDLDDTQHCAEFEFVISEFGTDSSVFFSAQKEEAIVNGVNILDILKITKHILGVERLKLFGRFSSDINLSENITSFDSFILKQFILGIYQDNPFRDTWNLLPDYYLPHINPLTTIIYPLEITVSELQALNGDTLQIIGYKTGDVDGDLFTDYTNLDSVQLLLPDIQLSANVPVTVPLYIQSDFDYSGLQIELKGAAGIVEIDTVLRGQLIDQPEFNIHYLSSNNIVRLISLVGGPLSSGTPLYYFTLVSNQDIPLKDAVSLGRSDVFPIIADQDCEPHQMVLDFRTNLAIQEPVAETLKVLNISPNPFIENVQIELELTSREYVLLEVLDLSGKLLYSSNTVLQVGNQQLEIPGSLLPDNSMLLYRISAGGQSISGKLYKNAKQ